MGIVTSEQFGARVQKWRERIGVDLSEVGARSGLSVPRVQAIEAGEGSLTAFEVYRIATALGADPGLLMRGEQAVGDPKRGAVRFKREGALADVSASDRRLLAVAAEVGRIGASLAQGRWSLPAYATPVDAKVEPWAQGYRLGAEARAALGLGDAPIAHLIDTLEGLGVHVAFVDFEDADIDAAAVREPDALPVILVNRAAGRTSEPRSLRPLLAHELCHLLHDNGEARLLTCVSRRSHHGDALERRANAFAPAFLAPPSGVGGAELSDEALVLRLVHHWSFTVRAASWHVRNLRHLPEARAYELADTARPAVAGRAVVTEVPNSAAEALPASPSPVTAGLVSRLAAEAWAAGHISEGRAREIARIA